MISNEFLQGKGEIAKIFDYRSGRAFGFRVLWLSEMIIDQLKS